MVLMIKIARTGMAARALGFSEKQFLTADFVLGRLGSIEAACGGVQFRRRRKIEHVLQLRQQLNMPICRPPR